MRTTIFNATVFTGDSVISPAVVVLEGANVAAVDPAGAEQTDAAPGSESSGTAAGSAGAATGPALVGETRIDAGGRLVTPGLVNAHTHIYSALARGITLKDAPPENFVEILERLWWRLDRALTLEDIDLSARLVASQCLRSGCTTLFDHHSSQGAVRGSLRTISRALADSGLRACLCFEVSDREGVGAARQGIEENLSFLDDAGSMGGMRRALFGLHASFTLSDSTLEASVQAVRSLLQASGEPTGFHIHVGEGPADRALTSSRTGQSPIERLHRVGALGPGTLCVHAVDVNDAELDLLSGSGAWVVHCPESNMNNGVGAASLDRLRKAGIPVALGTDGFTAEMPREMLVAHLLQNHREADPRAGYRHADLLFCGNALLASSTFHLDLGRLRPGAPADLVLWDYRPPTPVTVANLHGHVLFGLAGARAGEVWVNGKHVLRNGLAAGLDEAELAARCREAAERLWQRF